MTGRRGSPTVRRRRLGATLRRYRETAGLTIDHVAAIINCSTSKISRIETGQTGANPRDVRDMLMLYQVSEAELTSLMEVAEGTRQRGWWYPYGSILTGAYVGFEAAAQFIRSYEAQCVPGLLQTEEYARSLISAARRDLTPEEISGRVRLRMARQGLLTQGEPVTFWCVLDEAALCRPVGGAEVMAQQLDHLLAFASRPNVTLQVLPLDAGAHPGMEGSFALLRFPDKADPDTVYATMATGGVFHEKPDDIDRYALIFNCLQERALCPSTSAALIADKLNPPLPTYSPHARRQHGKGATTFMNLHQVVWRKSSRSGPWTDNCVEVAFIDGAVAVRDSKNPDGAVLVFTPTEWDAFVDGAKEGEFDL